MNEIEFLKRYRAEKIMLQKYADYACNIVTSSIISKLQIDSSKFFKVPISFRLKGEDSLIQKAFYRGKTYKDPYSDITDKIGGRIVVLLEEQASSVCNIIETLSEFVFSKDRDFDKEREKQPEFFSYQSHHYIIRNKEDLQLDEIIITSNTPIELQIRTLLQHAYSELTHDTIYKPNTAASPEVRRYVAKSIALIEITDQLFTQVNNSLKHNANLFGKIITELASLFPYDIKLNIDKRLCDYLLDAYLPEIEIFNIITVKKFVQQYEFVFDKIRQRSSSRYLYQQPLILFIYWIVSIKRKIAKSKWPLDYKELEEIFVDLGYSFDKS